MSFHKEPFRVLPGSLNLLPPADKGGDSLALTNWRSDQAGQLRSRRGMDQAVYLTGANGHTLFRQSPNRRFLGIDGLLYRSEGPNNYNQIASGFDGQPLGLETMAGFTWVMNQNLQGCDDGNGSAMKAWLPAAPASAPTVTAGGQIDKTVAQFGSSEAWTVLQPDGDSTGVITTVYSTAGTVAIAHSTDVEGTGTAFDPSFVGKRLQVSGDPVSYGIVAVISPTELTLDAPYVGTVSGVGFTIFLVSSVFDFNSAATINGHSLHIACNPAGSWVANLKVNEDLSINTQQRDEDKFRFWIYCSDPTAIGQITLQVDVNTGNFDLDTYVVTIPGSALNQGGFSWTQLVIRRALDTAAVLAANPDYASLQALVDAGILDSLLAFNRTGATAGQDWTTVKALRVTVNVTDDVDVNLAAWDVIGGATASLEGDILWFITFDTAAGHETNGSPAMAAALTLDNQAATLNNIPVSADPQVTSRNIYRQGGALAGPLRVGTINDNTTTTYLDQLPDSYVQALDIAMPIDHDPPPAAFGVIRHLGKLIAFNSLKHPGRFWWTKTGQPWYFPGADDEDVGQWQDTGEDDEAILGARSHNRTLIFYKERSIVRLYGDPDTSDPEETSSTIGLIGPRAHCEAGPIDYIAGAEGIYGFNAETATKISGKVDPIFKNDYTQISQQASVAVAPLNPDQKRNSVLEHINGRLYFSYPSLQVGGAQPDITLVCDLASGHWYHYLLDPALNGAGGFTALYYEGQDRALLGAISSANGIAVHQLELNTTDGPNAIPLTWQSAYADSGLPENPKVYGDLVIVHKTGDQNGTSPLVVSLYFDNGASGQVAIGTINSAARTTTVFPLGSNGQGIVARNFSLNISGDATTECIIFDAYMYWYVEARDGRTFDSGVIDLGSDKAKQIDQQELEVTGSANGTLTWYWRGDLPGGTIAQRQTGSVPISAGRANLRPAIPGYVEGRKVRLICIADVPFQLHAARARVLEIAEYVDGTAGEKWTPRVVDY